MRRTWKVAAAWVVLPCLLFLEQPARADEAPSPPTQSHWYGGKILITDAASIALFAGGWAFPPLGVVGAAGWFLGAPIQHGMHVGPGRAFGSFGLRLGLPFVGLLTGAVIGYWCPGVPSAQHCGTGAGLVGVVVGAAAAEVLDVAWLARDEHPIAPRAAAARPTPQLVLVPRNGGALVGLAAAF